MKGNSIPQAPWVERLRHFAAALIQADSIIEDTTTRLFKSLERILVRAVTFLGIVYAVYAVYQFLKHH